MPIDAEPNPDVYRGSELTVRNLMDRMADISGRGVHFSKPKGLGSHFVPMSRFSQNPTIVTRRSLLEVIEKTLVGNNFLHAFKSATGVLVVKSDPALPEIEGAAVYTCGTRTFKEDGTYHSEPYLSLDGFGFRNQHFNGLVLKEIAAQTIVTAERIAQGLEVITGRMNESYRACVMMNAHRNLRSTLPAEGVNMQFAILVSLFQKVAAGTPRMGTGFGQSLDEALAAYKELLRDHPNHAVVKSLGGIREFAMIEQALRLGGDEQMYVLAQKVYGATLAILTGIHVGVREQFEQLHPGTCGRPVEVAMTNAQPSGEFSLSLEDDNFPLGSATFLPQSVSDPTPEIEFECHGSDVISDIAGATLKHASQGEWWKAQLRG